MWLFDWLYNVLKSFGFYKEDKKLLFLGLENAGKTTLFGVLKTGQIKQHLPTHHPTSESMTLSGNMFTSIDVGGHIQARKTWRDYYLAVDGIVFIVDLSSHQKLWTAKDELDAVFSDDLLNDCPIAVLGNKIDKPGALSEEQFKTMFNLFPKVTGKTTKPSELDNKRPAEVFMCSIVGKVGYGDAFRWLNDQIV